MKHVELPLSLTKEDYDDDERLAVAGPEVPKCAERARSRGGNGEICFAANGKHHPHLGRTLRSKVRCLATPGGPIVIDGKMWLPSPVPKKFDAVPR